MAAHHNAPNAMWVSELGVVQMRDNQGTPTTPNLNAVIQNPSPIAAIGQLPFEKFDPTTCSIAFVNCRSQSFEYGFIIE